MRLYSYVLARDYGFAPNPFYGVCTLACCKPVIRRKAAIGDWIVGTGSAGAHTSGQLVYAMQINEIVSFDEYSTDLRFELKKPSRRGSIKQAFGDNIYHRPTVRSRWRQLDSHHSLADGSANPRNIANDTQTNRVLLGERFAYLGGEGPQIPGRLRDWDGMDLCAQRGHKVNFQPAHVRAFLDWFEDLSADGLIHSPTEWTRRRRGAAAEARA